MVYMTEKNVTTSVKISKSGNQCLDKIVEDSGIGKIELVSRMAEWLLSQNKTVRAIVLRQIESQDETEILDMIKSRLKEPYIDRTTNKLLFDVEHTGKTSFDQYRLAVRILEQREKDVKKLQAIVKTKPVEQSDTAFLARENNRMQNVINQLHSKIKQSSVPDETKADLLKLLDCKQTQQSRKRGRKARQSSSSKVG